MGQDSLGGGHGSGIGTGATPGATLGPGDHLGAVDRGTLAAGGVHDVTS